jgi:hypothetical protein
VFPKYALSSGSLLTACRKFSEYSNSIKNFTGNSGVPFTYNSNTQQHNNEITFESAVRNLFSFIVHPLSNPTFIDSDKNTWTYPTDDDWEPIWTAGLGKEVCIFDMDDREYNEMGQTFVDGSFSWDGMSDVPTGPYNHYLYCKTTITSIARDSF